MSFRNKATAGAVESRQNNGDGGEGRTTQDYGIDVDFDEVDFIRQSPTSFITGVLPSETDDEGRYKNPIIRFKNADYEEGRLDQGYLGFVLDDPEVIVDEEEGTDGTIILQTDDQDSTDIRVFDENDDQTKLVDGMGVKFGDRLYEGEVIDEFPGDRIILTVSGASAKNVAKRFDKRGGVNAGMDEEDGGPNGGLIEYKPNEDREGGAGEYTSRYTRDPELKESLHGERIGLFLGRREELDDEDTGYVGEDTAHEDLGEGEHNDPSEASYRELVENDEARPMYWHVSFNIDAEEEIEAEVTDDELVGYTYLDWRWDPSVGGMPDDQWEFVEQYVESAEAGEVETDEETIRENVNSNAGEFEDAPETDSMVNAIQNRV